MTQTLITQLRAMQERECASLGDMADQTAGRAADALEREMQRAEAAEVGNHSAAPGCGRQRLDRLHQPGARVDVHAGRLVAETANVFLRPTC